MLSPWTQSGNDLESTSHRNSTRNRPHPQPPHALPSSLPHQPPRVPSAHAAPPPPLCSCARACCPEPLASRLHAAPHMTPPFSAFPVQTQQPAASLHHPYDTSGHCLPPRCHLTWQHPRVLLPLTWNHPASSAAYNLQASRYFLMFRALNVFGRHSSHLSFLELAVLQVC